MINPRWFVDLNIKKMNAVKFSKEMYPWIMRLYHQRPHDITVLLREMKL